MFVLKNIFWFLIVLIAMSNRYPVDIPCVDVFFVDTEQFQRYQQVLSDSTSKVDGWKFLNSFGKCEWPVAMRSLTPHEVDLEHAERSGKSIISDCRSMQIYVRESRTLYSQVYGTQRKEILELCRRCCDSMIRRVSYYATCVGLDEFIPSVSVSFQLRQAVLEAKASIVSLQFWLFSLDSDAAVDSSELPGWQDDNLVDVEQSESTTDSSQSSDEFEGGSVNLGDIVENVYEIDSSEDDDDSGSDTSSL